MKIAIVYHFFANYRRPIVEYLHSDTSDEYVYVADPVNRLTPGVPAWDPPDDCEFVPVRGYLFARWFLLQPKVVLLAFRRDIETIVYLGNWQYLTTWFSVCLARLSGKKVLFWTHGWLAPEVGIKRLIRKAFYRLAHGLLLYGNVARDIGICEGFPAERLYVVFNSLDFETQKKIYESVEPLELEVLKTNFFDAPACPVVGLVGRLNKEKRVDLLIEAAARLVKEGRRINLLIVGDGEEREYLRHLAESRNVPVYFHGNCHVEEQVGRLLMCADLTVCPNAAGLTVTHSLAFGVPVVVGNLMANHGPEVEAIIPELTGAFFEHGSLDSLVETLRRLLFQENTLSPGACRHIVERFYNVKYQSQVFSRAVRLEPAVHVDIEESTRGFEGNCYDHRVG